MPLTLVNGEEEQTFAQNEHHCRLSVISGRGNDWNETLTSATGLTAGSRNGRHAEEIRMKFFDGHEFAVCGAIPKHAGETHNVPVYHGIQYNHEGRFWLRIDHGELLECEGPHVFITHPKAYFEYGSYPGETRYHTFICSYGERISQYISTGLLPIDNGNPLRKVADPGHFLDTMRKIIHLVRQSAPLVPPRAVLLYEDLLLQLAEPAPADRPVCTYHVSRFTALIEQIRKQPQREWDFSALAKTCNVTTTHFRRIFKALAGMAPQQFLIQCRLRLGAELLTTTGDSVGMIAQKTGFGDEFYFSRQFKAKFEVSPLTYRREVSRMPVRPA